MKKLSPLTWLLLVVVGFLVLLNACDLLPGVDTSWPKTKGNHEVMAIDAPKVRERSFSVLCQTREGRKVMLTCALPKGERVVPRVGDVLLLHTSIQTPRNSGNPGEMDYARWLWHRGVGGTAFCYAKEWRVYDGPCAWSVPWRVRLLKWRSRIVERYSLYLSDRSLAIVAAMSVGDKSLLDRDTRSLFSQVGASHVLDMSGLHLSILVGIYCFIVMRWLRRRATRVVAAVLGVVGMVLFVWMVGMPVSLVRAALMLSVVLLSMPLERGRYMWDRLTLAAWVILLCDVHALFDVGFQLSFVAVAAILWATRRFPLPRRFWPLCRPYADCRRLWLDEEGRRLMRRALRQEGVARPSLPSPRKQQEYVAAFSVKASESQHTALHLDDFVPKQLSLRGWCVVHWRLWRGRCLQSVWSMLVVSLAAQLATLALVVWYFGIIPVWGLPMSFVALPLTTLILCLALVLLALPWLAPFTAVALRWAVTAFETSLVFFASLPGGNVHCDVRAMWQEEPAVVVWNTWKDTRITSQEGVWQGDVLFYPGGKLASALSRVPYGHPSQPLQVDYLVISRGAKGDLCDWLQLYSPRTVVLDANLSDYYYRHFRQQALDAHFPLWDIREQGALVIAK